MRILPMLWLLVTSCAVDADSESPATSETSQDLESWSTTLDVTNMQFHGVAISPLTHTGIVVGAPTTGGWTVMRNPNTVTWTRVDTSFGPQAFAQAVAVGINGYFYVVGFGTINGSQHGIVRRSTDDGKTWTTAFDLTTHTSEQMLGVTMDVHSTAFVTGTTLDSGSTRAVVWRGTGSGTWQEVHAYSGASSSDAVALRGACTGLYSNQAAVYAIGNTSVADGSDHLIAKASTDNGVTWHTAFDFVTLDDSGGTGCAQASASAMWFTGYDVGSTQSNFHVFNYTGSGHTGNYVFSSQLTNRANGVVVLPDRTYAVGTVWSSAGRYWRVRLKVNVGLWVDSDLYQKPDTSGVEATAYGAAYDDDLGLLVVGAVVDNVGRYHGLIRHLNSP